MAKKTSDVDFLCVEIYKDELDKDSTYTVTSDGLSSHQRELKRLINTYGETLGNEIFQKNANNVYKIKTEATLEAIKKLNFKPKKTKGKEPAKNIEFNPDYVFELSVQVYTDRLNASNKPDKNGTTSSQRQLAIFVKRRGSKEAGLKRYRDYAQNYAPHVRAVLRVLKMQGKLPKEAEA